MNKSLQSLLNSLKDEFHPRWNVEKIALNGRYGTFQETPLHIFSVRGDLNACKTLIKAGAKLDIPGEHRYTPLHEAIHQEHIAVVELLLRSGADPSLMTDIGTTKSLAADSPEIGRLLEDNSEQNGVDQAAAHLQL